MFSRVTKIYDKRGGFDFEIVHFPFLDGDVPRSAYFGVYVFQLVRFTGASGYVAGFYTRSGLLTQKLLKQGYRYHGLRKTFFRNFIDDTMVWFLNSGLDLGLSCTWGFRSLISMVAWCVG